MSALSALSVFSDITFQRVWDRLGFDVKGKKFEYRLDIKWNNPVNFVIDGTGDVPSFHYKVGVTPAFLLIGCHFVFSLVTSFASWCRAKPFGSQTTQKATQPERCVSAASCRNSRLANGQCVTVRRKQTIEECARICR